MDIFNVGKSTIETPWLPGIYICIVSLGYHTNTFYILCCWYAMCGDNAQGIYMREVPVVNTCFSNVSCCVAFRELCMYIWRADYQASMKLKLSYQKEPKYILQLHESLCDTLLASVVVKYCQNVTSHIFKEVL